MKISDKIFGAVLIAYAIFLLYFAKSMPTLPGYAIGAGTFPTVIALILLLCGVLLFVRSLKVKDKMLVLGEWTKSRKLVSNICLIPGSLLFYILVSDFLGFLPTVVIMTSFTIWWLRGKFLTAFIVAVGTALFAYGFFSKIMLVPLPVGLLGF